MPWQPTNEDGTLHGDWNKTYFLAALDLAKGIAWPEFSSNDFYGTSKTQRRHISSISQIFGFNSDNEDVHGKVSEFVGLSTLEITDIAMRCRDGPFSERAITLKQITLIAHETYPLGHLLGIWGTAILPYDSRDQVSR